LGKGSTFRFTINGKFVPSSGELEKQVKAATAA
jgi:hypothetical protein